jgi:hypothetical protein
MNSIKRRGLGRTVSQRLWPLEPGRLCRAARGRAALDHFGDPPLEPALSTLCQSLEQAANLHALGRFIMRIHLRDLLETRLKLAAAWEDKLEALDAVRLEKPVFIIGMPRSGSTFLHELLAEDDANRSPRVWEVMSPVAAAEAGQRERNWHIRKAEFCLWWFRRLAPRANSVYPMRALTPHECVAIQSYTFLSEEFISTCTVPTYEAFLHGADLTPAYAFEKRFLQYLQLGRPEPRWVLKSPDHVCGLEALFAIFPDAFIVQTHRNPLEVLRSSTELTRVLHGLYGPRGHYADVWSRETRVLAERTERFIRFRDEHPELADRFIDVKYSDLVAQPMAAVRQIYEQLETPLSAVAAERMQRLAASRSRYQKRRAAPEPAASKPEAVQEADRFKHYCSRFDLPFTEAGLKR